MRLLGEDSRGVSVPSQASGRGSRFRGEKRALKGWFTKCRLSVPQICTKRSENPRSVPGHPGDLHNAGSEQNQLGDWCGSIRQPPERETRSEEDARLKCRRSTTAGSMSRGDDVLSLDAAANGRPPNPSYRDRAGNANAVVAHVYLGRPPGFLMSQITSLSRCRRVRSFSAATAASRGFSAGLPTATRASAMSGRNCAFR